MAETVMPNSAATVVARLSGAPMGIRTDEKRRHMLGWALTLLVIALIAMVVRAPKGHPQT